MMRHDAYKGVMRSLGVCVLAVFLFGFTSGPLRTCFSHPGHASGEHAGEMSTEHMADHHASAPSDRAPMPEHEGCSCLGQCSLEHAPYLPGVDVPALAHLPSAPKALEAVSASPLTQRDLFGLPLARPPPAVV